MFPKFGEQGLKKMLKDAGIEVDRDQNLYTISNRLGYQHDEADDDKKERQEFT